jgi:outer membrane receptor for ferrienterochelin and colicin
MQEDVSFLTEVLVTGYQTLSRKNAPGSYVIVDKKELEARNNRTIEGMLEGLVPGLSVYKGGNGLNDLRIRGGKFFTCRNTTPDRDRWICEYHLS